MPIFETHCHLNHEYFDGDLSATLDRARLAGVSELLIIGCEPASSRRAIELADPSQGLYAAVGIHPHSAAEWTPAAEEELRELSRQPGVLAIGEIGLDFYRDLSDRGDQERAFRDQLALAVELDLPVIVHTRESVTPSLDMMEPFIAAGLRGLMHCWSGTAAEARRAVQLGLVLGIGGVITYKKPGALPEVVLETPLDHLVLETDSPYLPPVPHRGKRNEPAYVALVASRVAELRGIPVEELAAATRRTALHLFRLPSPA